MVNYVVTDINSEEWEVRDASLVQVLPSGLLQFQHNDGTTSYFGPGGWITFDDQTEAPPLSTLKN